MHAVAVQFDLHIPAAHSLKEKRAVIRPIIDGLRNRHRVSAAEVGDQDLWQRSRVGVAAVSGSDATLNELIDDVDRFVWSFPEVEVLDASRHWIEVD